MLSANKFRATSLNQYLSESRKWTQKFIHVAFWMKSLRGESIEHGFQFS